MTQAKRRGRVVSLRVLHCAVGFLLWLHTGAMFLLGGDLNSRLFFCFLNVRPNSIHHHVDSDCGDLLLSTANERLGRLWVRVRVRGSSTGRLTWPYVCSVRVDVYVAHT